MTTTASPKVSLYGSSVLIEGTVTDISAGLSQNEQVARFPNGVAVVSDESMTPWMEYVYMDQPRPTNASGVKVSIDVIDANNNYRNIGEATSDLNGCFSYEWQPDIPGKYTVIASFAGTQSYWPSHAETSFAVDEAAITASPQPQQVAQSPTDMYIIGTGIAVIVAIAIVGTVILMAVKKRP
jgi:hypothetical protein